MSFYVLLFHLLSGNTEGVRAGEGLFEVEVGGSGVGVGGGDASAMLSGEIILSAVAKACRALFQGRWKVINEVLTPV